MARPATCKDCVSFYELHDGHDLPEAEGECNPPQVIHGQFANSRGVVAYLPVPQTMPACDQGKART